MIRGKLALPSRIANPWLLFSWIYRLTATATEELDQKKRLDEFTRQMIRKRRDAVKRAAVGERKSLLDYMLEISDSNPDFTEQDIVNEACTFMLAVSRPENYSRCDFHFAIFRFLSSSCVDAGSGLGRSFAGVFYFSPRTESKASREVLRGNKRNLWRRRATTNHERLEGDEASGDVHKGSASVICAVHCQCN